MLSQYSMRTFMSTYELELFFELIIPRTQRQRKIEKKVHIPVDFNIHVDSISRDLNSLSINLYSVICFFVFTSHHHQASTQPNFTLDQKMDSTLYTQLFLSTFLLITIFKF